MASHHARSLLPAALVTLALFGVLFLPDYLAGRTFAFRDVPNYHLPVARVVSEELRAGRFPHWNPYLACGIPLAANPNHYVFYPTRALDLVFPPEAALQIHLMVHWAAGGLAMAVLALLLGTSSAGAAGAALAYLLAGPTLSLLNFANLAPFLLWIPATAAASVALARAPGPRRAALLSVCLAIQTTFAEPGLLMVEAMVVGALLAIDRRRARRSLLRAIPWAALAIGVALLLAAPVWIPTLRLVAESARDAATRADLRYSVRPAELFHLGVPQLFGDYHTLEKLTFWGETFHEGRGPFFLSLSLGTVALALGVAGAVSRGPRGAILVIASLLGIALSMGAWFAPLRPIMFSEAGRWVRWPVKFTLVPAVLLPVAIAAGIDVLAAAARARRASRGPSTPDRRWARIAVWAGVIAAAAFSLGAFRVAAHFDVPPALWVQDAIGPIAYGKNVPEILERAGRACARSGAASAALAAVGFVVAIGWIRAGAHRALIFLLPGLIGVELALPQRGVNRGTPSGITDIDTPVLRDAKGIAGDSFRVHFPIDHWNATLGRRAGMPDEWWPRLVFDREIGAFYHPMGEGIPSVLVDPDRLVPVAAARRQTVARSLAPGDRERMLRLLGVAGEVRIGEAALATGRPAYATQAGWPVSIAVDSLAVPVAHRAPRVSDPAGGSEPWQAPFLSAWEEAIRAARGDGEVRVLERTPGRWVLSTDGAAAGRVGLTESRIPGWDARVDGAPAEIEPYLSDFMAVRVPAGSHRVEWRWRPPGYAGLWVASGLGWLLLGAAVVRRARPPHGNATRG